MNGINITLTKEQLDQIELQKKKTPEGLFEEPVLVYIKAQKRKSPEELFKVLVLDRINIHNPVVDLEKYPNHIFWLDGDGKYISEWDRGTKRFYFKNETVWFLFRLEFNLDYIEVQKIMGEMVEKHFKLKGVAPIRRVRASSMLVEKYFKNKLG